MSTSNAERFITAFARLRERGECGLFPYLTAGFPDEATSLRLADAALEAGADGFEIGVPFSDPMADGATLQRANARALDNGATLETAFSLTRHIRAQAPDAPIVLMSYYNPVLQPGEDAFARALKAAGGDGLIVPDLPLDEAASMRNALGAEGLHLVPMLAPTSTAARVQASASLAARSFVYCVALVGVTGARASVADNLGEFLGRVRQAGEAPRVVGFGIARPEHAHAVSSLGAEGVIVASALADLVEKSSDPVRETQEYLRSMKEATRTGAVPVG